MEAYQVDDGCATSADVALLTVPMAEPAFAPKPMAALVFWLTSVMLLRLPPTVVSWTLPTRVLAAAPRPMVALVFWFKSVVLLALPPICTPPCWAMAWPPRLVAARSERARAAAVIFGDGITLGPVPH
jgi:hypothetical protein